MVGTGRDKTAVGGVFPAVILRTKYKYSPELNPDEYLNCDLKRGLSPKHVKQLQQNVEEHMNMLQQNPDRVAKYFTKKEIQYAA